MHLQLQNAGLQHWWPLKLNAVKEMTKKGTKNHYGGGGQHIWADFALPCLCTEQVEEQIS